MRKTVLVVDDDVANRMLMSEILGMMDLDVRTAENGLVALKATEEAPFDLVICDNNMPKMSGIEFYAALLKKNPDLTRRFIFASASINTAYFAPDCPVLTKPYSIDAFKQTVQGMLASEQTARQA